VKEVVLRDFFEGHAAAAELDTDVAGTQLREGPEGGPYVYRYRVLPMDREYALQPEHLVKLLDATAAGELQIQHLQIVCTWLEGAFDRFLRDVDTPGGERVADALFWLGTPEINYPLTPIVLSKIRHYLVTGEKLLTRADTRSRSTERLHN
jgi:hypothetical protein